MVAILVILTFAVMLLIDHLVTRQPIIIAEAAPAAGPERPRVLSPIVAGFNVPDNLRYHPGHTWAIAETPELVRVGVDDFAAKIVGKVAKIDLPQRGQWVRQGQKVFSFRDGEKKIDMVSPIEGTVVEINEKALETPDLTRNDPYGEGWLLEVHSPDQKTNFKNLMNGTLARRWIEEAAARLRAMVPTPAGAYAFAQDGGIVADDVLSLVSDRKAATQEFFLTA
ncbi:MAG TPA: glycine cleavage system protein H [Thermoanaerobaculia bacterium]|nr:glycine cleavage system protein H [Thermoanaerobaculia bacterium]